MQKNNIFSYLKHQCVLYFLFSVSAFPTFCKLHNISVVPICSFLYLLNYFGSLTWVVYNLFLFVQTTLGCVYFQREHISFCLCFCFITKHTFLKMKRLWDILKVLAFYRFAGYHFIMQNYLLRPLIKEPTLFLFPVSLIMRTDSVCRPLK